MANCMSFDEVMAAIKTERQYQLMRWGYRQEDGSMEEAQHGVTDWLVYIQHYLNIAFEEAATKPGNEPAMEVLRKITAMGVAACEQNGVESRPVGMAVVNGRDLLVVSPGFNF